ncbi:MAG: hypothetical protein PCFJNLEI_00564 [Verrucomicrobiae bacterium]|nr:hypothetical protein [Verrucomicrobiae bacterium]
MTPHTLNNIDPAMNKRHGLTRALACLLMIALSFQARAADVIWVGPGHKSGDGTRDNPFSFSQAFSGETQIKPGSTVHLRAGTYQPEWPNTTEKTRATTPKVFHMALQGESNNVINVIAEPGVHLDGCLEINSSHLRLTGLEVGNSRYVVTNLYPPALELMASRNVEIINCNFFGAGSTVTFLQLSKDILIYGCLIHDSCGLPHGASNCYLQNAADSTKTVEQCVAYRSSAQNLGVHVYSADAAHNVRFLDNIAFLGGGVVTQKNWDNIFINPGVPFVGIEVTGNVAYQHETACGWRPNVRFSSKKEAKKTDYTNVRGIVRDNWFMGGLYAVSMGRWKQMTFENNTLWAEKLMIEINSATMADAIPAQDQKPDLSGYRLAGNHYFTTPDATSFRYDRVGKIEQGDPLLTFAQWQALSLDKDSALEKTVNGRPTGTMVRVYANRHEKGRGHVAIFNWDRHDSVTVDLSKVLTKGDPYQIYNCADVTHTLAATKPVLTGVYEGGELAFPMKKDAASPDFDAFLVRHTQSAPGLPGPKER